MKQQLRKPENWQDFEELCQILWGEIWRCPETKRNGRGGQNQAGVDVYGVPKGEDSYYGIQCKGKDDYTNSQLSTKEIDSEIEKAKRFKPSLKKFYFATTANKDVAIEEYVRERDIEFRRQGLFEIHLFSWEDIVGLIDQYQRAHDWYVKNLNFRSHFAASVTFADGSDKILAQPTLFRNFIYHQRQGEFNPIVRGDRYLMFDTPIDYWKIYKEHKDRALSPQPFHYENKRTFTNKSSILFQFLIENTGDRVIEDFKLEFSINGDVVIEVVNKKTGLLDLTSYSYNLHLNDPHSGVYEPHSKILIQQNKIKSDLLCIRPTIEEAQEVTIDWRLLCRDFNDRGQLIVSISPQIKLHEQKFYFYTEVPKDDTLVYDESLRRSFRLENEIDEDN